MRLGSYDLSSPVFLAPMAGVSDVAMRRIAVKWGAGVAVGEMVSSDLSLYQSNKTSQRLQHDQSAGIRSIQLVGNDSLKLAEAAKLNVDLGAEIIDINMGCPAKKVCKKAAGSALLADPSLVEDILGEVVNASAVPVTLKIRTGVDRTQRNGVEIAKIAERCGVSMLTVHGRTRADRFNGEAEHETTKAIVNAVGIPVIANGDITDLDSARAVLTHTRAAGVMIGRAAQGRLWLPGYIAQNLLQKSQAVPGFESRLEIMREHADGIYELYGSFMGCRIVRKHVGWFLDAEGGKSFKPLKSEFNQLDDIAQQATYMNQLDLKMMECLASQSRDSRLVA